MNSPPSMCVITNMYEECFNVGFILFYFCACFSRLALITEHTHSRQHTLTEEQHTYLCNCAITCEREPMEWEAPTKDKSKPDAGKTARLQSLQRLFFCTNPLCQKSVSKLTHTQWVLWFYVDVRWWHWCEKGAMRCTASHKYICRVRLVGTTHREWRL